MSLPTYEISEVLQSASQSIFWLSTRHFIYLLFASSTLFLLHLHFTRLFWFGMAPKMDIDPLYGLAWFQKVRLGLLQSQTYTKQHLWNEIILPVVGFGIVASLGFSEPIQCCRDHGFGPARASCGVLGRGDTSAGGAIYTSQFLIFYNHEKKP